MASKRSRAPEKERARALRALAAWSLALGFVAAVALALIWLAARSFDPELPLFALGLAGAVLLAIALAPAIAFFALARWIEKRRALGSTDARALPLPRAATDARWIPPGASCTVAGRTIAGGMIYLGRALGLASGAPGQEPALVDPTLEADSALPLPARRTLQWPSYDALAPSERSRYLDWLAGGRRDERAPVGCAWLFLYGLERRLLLDAEQGSVGAGEVEALARELLRLARLHEANAAFRAAAQSLADYAWVRHLPQLDPDPAVHP